MYYYQDLADKNVLVSGASGDIGLAICHRFLDQKAQVYAIYHSHPDTLNALKDTHELGKNLHIMRCDLSNKDSISDLCQKLSATVGHIDVLINNAGIVKDALFSAMSTEDFEAVINTNLLSAFCLTRETLRLLRASDSASVVNVASIAALIPSIGQCNYSASKGALLSFTRTLAAELAAKKVRINAVAPGMIESTMVKKVSRTVVRDTVNAIPIKRLGQCKEVAEAILFLSSDASSYIVGQTLVVDGGLVMR